MANPSGIVQPYGVGISQAISSGDIGQMQEMATVSNYMMRTLPIDPSTQEGKAWQEAHQKLLSALATQMGTDIQLNPAQILLNGADGVTVIANEELGQALRTLMASGKPGQFIKLILG